MSTAIDFLKKHESVSSVHFEENAKWRKENRAWLEWSRNITLWEKTQKGEKLDKIEPSK